MFSLTDVDAQRAIDEAILEHEETISELKKRILELKATILALKTRRNTHCAISKIPTELISDVFLHAKRYAQQSQADHNRCDKNWLNVSSVCSQWRAIVLDTPHLWCCINLVWRESRTLAFLERSKSVPLRLWYTSPGYGHLHFDSPVTKAAIAEQGRIQELDIVLYRLDSFVQLLNLIPSGSAPVLKILKLSLYDDWYEKGMAIPDGLLWHDMPALQVLELRNISLRSRLPVLPCLTRLVLRNQPASWVIQSLRNTPLVEEIDISDLSSDFGTGIPAPISLPNLTSLQIHAVHSSASKIFDFIEYPHSAIVNCKFDCLDNESDLSILQRVYSRFANRRAIVRVHIHIYHAFITVKMWPSGAESYSYLTLPLPQAASQSIAQYLQPCSLLDCSAHTLALIFKDQVPTGMLAVWSIFRQVTNLRLTGCNADTLLSLLRAGNTERPPLEKLEIITISESHFNQSFHTQPGRRRDGAMCDAMTSVLRQRKELGIPIRKLILMDCKPSKEVVKEFEEHVNVHHGKSV